MLSRPGVGDAEVLFGVLIEIFGGNGVAADRGLPCEDDVALEYLMGAAADLDVGTAAVEGLAALWYALLLLRRAGAAIAPARRTLI